MTQSTLHLIHSACGLDHIGVADYTLSLGRLHNLKSRTISNAMRQYAIQIVESKNWKKRRFGFIEDA